MLTTLFQFKRVYIEASTFRFENEYFRNFGLIYVFKDKSPDGAAVD